MAECERALEHTFFQFDFFVEGGLAVAGIRLFAHLEHALKYGYDHDRGGLYSRGFDNQPATDTDKVWWVQAEMLAALTDGIKHKENPAYSEALDKLLQFITTYQANPADGIWLDTVLRRLRHARDVFPELDDQIDRLDRIYIFTYFDGEGPGNTFGLVANNGLESDLYQFLRGD
jgi:hypothetical protein